MLQDWTIAKAAELYGIRDWSAGYFGLSDDGQVNATVDFPSGRVSVPLMDMVSGMIQRGLQLPVVLRVENLLDAQIAQLNESFREAIRTLGYRGEYRGVFPIKVNQQRQVIEEVTAFGARYKHGLEAGSKAELIIALSMLGSREGMIVCNGFKDREFIELGLLAQKIGYHCVFVIESPKELPTVLSASETLGVRPRIGVRIKLSSRVGGLWNESSGDRSIFGLTTNQLIGVVDHLKARDMLDCLELLHMLHDVYQAISPTTLQECYKDALYYLDEIRDLFRRGQIRLRAQAIAENQFLQILHGIARAIESGVPLPTELQPLAETIADIYYGNFSVFQSLPDSWAIGQLFPVMPIHRHKEPPTRQAIIADMTCDSDGKIDRFIDPHQVKKTLPVHPLREGEEYYLGVFLVGAYQETLGDLHNLMGDTHVVSVRINEDGSFDFVKEIHGDGIADVLSYLEYDPRELRERFRKSAEQAVKAGRIRPAERQHVPEEFSASLRGYTYFEK